MVQFLSINFFSSISSIFVGFFKSSRYFVSLCMSRNSSISLVPIQIFLYISLASRSHFLKVKISVRL